MPTVTKTVTLEVVLDWWEGGSLRIITCHKCNAPVALTEDHYRRARENQEVDFYCARGHPAIFTETKLQKAQKELALAQERANAEATKRQQAEVALAVAEAGTKRQIRRAEAGVCPQCHRTFVQVARHMASKHPAPVSLIP